MTPSEWQTCDDAWAMIQSLWNEQGISPADHRFSGNLKAALAKQSVVDLDGALQRYYLASCRGIWKLLPQEASRRGVELAEQFLAGMVSFQEYREYNWFVEGAAFCFDFNSMPEAIDGWIAEVRAIPEAELRSMLHPPSLAQEIDPRDLLSRAAYFVDYATVYPLQSSFMPTEDHRLFLSAPILRQYVGCPVGSPDR